VAGSGCSVGALRPPAGCASGWRRRRCGRPRLWRGGHRIVLGLAVGLQHGRRAVTVSAAYVAGGHASAEGLREPLALGADGGRWRRIGAGGYPNG
jgi:hypothetical protein